MATKKDEQFVVCGGSQERSITDGVTVHPDLDSAIELAKACIDEELNIEDHNAPFIIYKLVPVLSIFGEEKSVNYVQKKLS